MNASESNKTSAGQRAVRVLPGWLAGDDLEPWLDRLVDGELDGPCQKQFLSKLDDVPGGWRRCALAFLESRAWTAALRDALQAASVRTTSATKAVAKAGPPPAGPAKRRFAGLVPWLSRLAVAASFLVAFGLGLRIQGYLERNDTPTTSVASDTLPPTTPAAMQDERWDTVRLVVDEQEGAPGQIEVPVVEGPDALQWVTSRPPAMPPHVAGELRSQGYDVLTERHLIYVDLEDGRRVVFPVDEIKVQLVRRAQ